MQTDWKLFGSSVVNPISTTVSTLVGRGQDNRTVREFELAKADNMNKLYLAGILAAGLVVAAFFFSRKK